MRVPRTLAALVILALLVAGLPLSLRPHQALAANTTIVVTMNSATKVFDLGPSDNQLPDGWNEPNFDVSLWDHAVPVSATNAACVHNALGPLGHLPLYWGATANDYYLVRISFSVPAASSYDGSNISFANYDGDDQINLTDSNNTENRIGNRFVNSLHVFSVGSLLKPGVNVLGLWEWPAAGSESCGPAIGVRISIQAQGVKGGVPAPRPAPAGGPAVALSFPTDKAIVTGPSLPLSWSPYPHASAYLVHVWLVKADPGQTITATTIGSRSMTVLGTRASVSTAGMLKGMYAWDVAALNAKGALIAGWGTARNVQLE